MTEVTLTIIYLSLGIMSSLAVLCKQCKPKFVELKKYYYDDYKYEKISTDYVDLNNIENSNNLQEVNLQETNLQEIDLNKLKKNEKVVINFE